MPIGTLNRSNTCAKALFIVVDSLLFVAGMIIQVTGNQRERSKFICYYGKTSHEFWLIKKKIHEISSFLTVLFVSKSIVPNSLLNIIHMRT